MMLTSGDGMAFANANTTCGVNNETNDKTSKIMRVKIKGIKELQDAMYSFDDNGKLAGIVLCEDADNGIYNTYPMDLVQNIYDE